MGPTEERLLPRTPLARVITANKKAVWSLVLLGSTILMLLVYGIITAGRAPVGTAGSGAAAPLTSSAKEWYSDIPDTRAAPSEPKPTPSPQPPAPAVPPAPPGLFAPQKPSPEEQHQEALARKRFEEFLAAREAKPLVPLPLAPHETAQAPPVPPPSTEHALKPPPPSAEHVVRTAYGTEEEPDENHQAHKLDFIKEAAKAYPGYLEETRRSAVSPHEVKAGTIIPAVLLTEVNSDLPGHVVAQVRENVFDTVGGENVLIPQGSRLVGRYQSEIAYGQRRVLVVWDRLLFPDGSSLPIQGMPGTDSVGAGGFEDEVDYHLWRLLGGVLLGSILGAGAQAAYGPYTTVNPDIGSLVIQGAARDINQAGSQITRKNLNVQPTLVIRPGYLFNVFVTQDMVLPVYRGG